MELLLIDGLGWIGSILLITAYYQNSRDHINSQTSMYQILNVSGSILLTINTLYHGAYPSSTVNFIWVFIGAYYLIQNRKNEKVR